MFNLDELVTAVNFDLAASFAARGSMHHDIRQSQRPYMEDNMCSAVLGELESLTPFQAIQAFQKAADICGQKLWTITQELSNRGFNVGSTLVSALVYDNWAVVANTGDSKAIYLRLRPDPSEQRFDLVTANLLHTPEAERTRIEQAGGSVLKGRLNGLLATSRSFGDAAIGKGITDQFEYTVLHTRPDSYLCLITDGVYNRLNDAEILRIANNTDLYCDENNEFSHEIFLKWFPKYIESECQNKATENGKQPYNFRDNRMCGLMRVDTLQSDSKRVRMISVADGHGMEGKHFYVDQLSAWLTRNMTLAVAFFLGLQLDFIEPVNPSLGNLAKINIDLKLYSNNIYYNLFESDFRDQSRVLMSNLTSDDLSDNTHITQIIDQSIVSNLLRQLLFKLTPFNKELLHDQHKNIETTMRAFNEHGDVKGIDLSSGNSSTRKILRIAEIFIQLQLNSAHFKIFEERRKTELETSFLNFFVQYRPLLGYNDHNEPVLGQNLQEQMQAIPVQESTSGVYVPQQSLIANTLPAQLFSFRQIFHSSTTSGLQDSLCPIL